MTNTIYFPNIDRDNYSSSSSRSDFDVEIVSIEDVDSMQLEVLKEKIRVWNISMPIALKSVKEQSFYYVTVNTVENLLSFGDAVARSKISPDKLFMVLDMYNTMSQLQPELQTTLAGEAYYDIRESASTIKNKLADMARSTLDGFDEAVKNNVTEIDILDGDVHPLTHYVINFLNLLLRYESTVKQLLEDFEMNDGTDTLMKLVIFGILQALQTTLDRKSEKYGDPALNRLFLMNNVHHIVTFGRSKAKDLLGDEWVQIHQGIVQRHAYQYIRISLQKVLEAISEDGLYLPGRSTVNMPILKARFKKFNKLFEDLCQRGSQCTVPDSELQGSLRISLTIMLVPAYRNFVGRYANRLIWKPNVEAYVPNDVEAYVRYKPDDIERMLGELFEEKEKIGPKLLCL